jgi:hypothetical protein
MSGFRNFASADCPLRQLQIREKAASAHLVPAEVRGLSAFAATHYGGYNSWTRQQLWFFRSLLATSRAKRLTGLYFPICSRFQHFSFLTVEKLFHYEVSPPGCHRLEVTSLVVSRPHEANVMVLKIATKHLCKYGLAIGLVTVGIKLIRSIFTFNSSL